MNSVGWFFVGVLTGSLGSSVAIFLAVEWVVRKKR